MLLTSFGFFASSFSRRLQWQTRRWQKRSLLESRLRSMQENCKLRYELMGPAPSVVPGCLTRMLQLSKTVEKFKKRNSRVEQLKSQLRETRVSQRSQELSRVQSQAALEQKDKEIGDLQNLLEKSYAGLV